MIGALAKGMEAGAWAFGAVLIFAAGALLVLCTGTAGVWRFRNCLSRLHAAAVNDTLGLGLAMLSLIVGEGFTFLSLKYLLVLIFLWAASPVSSHLIAKIEVSTNPELQKQLPERTLPGRGKTSVGKEADR